MWWNTISLQVIHYVCFSVIFFNFPERNEKKIEFWIFFLFVYDWTLCSPHHNWIKIIQLHHQGSRIPYILGCYCWWCFRISIIMIITTIRGREREREKARVNEKEEKQQSSIRKLRKEEKLPLNQQITIALYVWSSLWHSYAFGTLLFYFFFFGEKWLAVGSWHAAYIWTYTMYLHYTQPKMV